MAITIDDLFQVATQLRQDVQYVAHNVHQVEQAVKGKGGGGGGGGGTGQGGGNPVASLGQSLEKFMASAGKAGVALATFNVLFEKMIAGLGQGIAKFVSLANPAAVLRFNLAVENAQSALGRVFLPVLERFTAMIQKLGDAIESLSPAAKALLGSLAAGGGLATAFGAIATAAVIVIRVLGGWPAIIATVVGALAGVFVTMDSGKGLIAAFNSVLKQVGAIFEMIARAGLPIIQSAVGPVMEAVGVALKAIAQTAGRLVAALMPAQKAFVEVFAAVATLFGEVVSAAMPLIDAILVPMAALISVVARALADFLVPALERVAHVIRAVANFIANTVGKLLDILGIDVSLPEYDPNKNRAQAVRQSQITDLRSFANRAYTSAFGGAAGDVQGQILKENKQMNQHLKDIAEKMGIAVHNGATAGGVQAGPGLGGVAGGPAIAQPAPREKGFLDKMNDIMNRMARNLG